MSEDCLDSTVWNNAYKVLKRADVRARVVKLKNELGNKYEIDRGFIIQGYLEIINDSDETFTIAGLMDPLKDDRSRFFRMMQQTKNSDKLRALEQLTKMLGLNEPEQSKSEQQITINIKRDRDK